MKTKSLMITTLLISTLTYFVIDCWRNSQYNKARLAAGESNYERRNKK